MIMENLGRKLSLRVGALCVTLLVSACTPRPSDRYLFTRGAELKPGSARMLVLHENTNRKKLVDDLAHAFQVCLLNRNAFFSGMRLEGPRQVSSGVWQISLVDPESKENRGRDVLVTVGNPLSREGILKALPKGVSLGKGSITVKRLGAVNRTDSVLGVVADHIAGLAPCDGIEGTGVSLVVRAPQPAVSTAPPAFPQYPLPKFYPQFYR